MALTDAQIEDLIRRRSPGFAEEATLFFQGVADLAILQRSLPVVDPDGADDEVDPAIVDNVPPCGWIGLNEIKTAGEEMAKALSSENWVKGAVVGLKLATIALGGI